MRFVLEKKFQRDKFKKGDPVYCCSEHGYAARALVSSRTMAETNRKYASERMLARNPMKRADARQKVSESLKQLGHRPSVRGGNGQALPPAQQRLLERLLQLSSDWVPEYSVPTHTHRGTGLSTNYKCDLANPQKKLAVEIDGSSHRSLKAQERDGKKTQFLVSQGWAVLRFSNREAVDHLDNCVDAVLLAERNGEARRAG